MSKFPNQLAFVGVVGVSVIALSVGLSERAAHKAAEAAHEAEAHAAAATMEPVAQHEDPAAEETAAAPAAEEATETAEAASAPEPVAAQEADTAEAVPAADMPASEETTETASADTAPEPDAVEEVAAAEATPVPVVDGATDTLNGQGDTMAVAGEDTAPAHAKFGLGRVALPEEIAAWNLDIMPDGTGLPEGEGDVWTGDEVFAENCAVCHGDFAEGVDNWPKLAGGKGTLDRKDPVKTVGSYWPYLSTTYDYVRRSMPFGMAQTLSDDDVYAIVAYILYSNDLVDEDFVLSKDTFLDVEMPNADGFIVDDRAETEYDQFSQEPCMESCKESVEITMRAAVLDVTPDHGGDEAAAEPAPEDDASQMAEATPEEATAESAEESASAPAAESEAAPETADASTPDAAPESADDSEPEAAAEEAAAVAVAADPELVAAGEKVFKKCQACHQVGEGAKNRVGPVLNGVVGRTAGTLDGFKYSKAMIGAGEEGLTWTSETLHEYLADPKGYLKGNKMAFAGLKKPDDVDAVVAFLEAHP